MLLQDISARSGTPTPLPDDKRITLEVITYIGVVVSLLGLLLTFITYIVFKYVSIYYQSVQYYFFRKLREKDASKFHLQFCVALFVMLLVFVCGIDKFTPRGGCITVGLLIHYFALVTWMFMGAEALLMCHKLVVVFTNITWRYLLIVSLVCWCKFIFNKSFEFKFKY